MRAGPTARQSRTAAAAAACFCALLAHSGPAFAQDDGSPAAQPLSETAQQQQQVSFELVTRTTIPGGAVRSTEWLSDGRALLLVAAPEGAAVYSVNFSELGRTLFMSAQFINANICPPEYADSLQMALSPSRGYLLFTWSDAAGARSSVLVGIDAAPRFRLRRFSLPPGMQVEQAIFSPDDRHLVLTHDGYRTGSDVAVLVLDLQTGAEAWRIASHQLSFIRDIWWSHTQPGRARFSLIAEMHDGEFMPGPRRFDCAIDLRTAEPADGPEAVLGAEMIWGVVLARKSDDGSGEYFIELDYNGSGATARDNQVRLTSEPRELIPLPDPGLALLRNMLPGGVSQLWLLNLNTGERFNVDGDCDSASYSADGMLLVRGALQNEVRLYRIVRPQSAPAAQ